MHNREYALELCRGLNKQQHEAVLHREGPALITAGPGSGKTHVITTRLLYMIHVHGILPEKIMVITFTKAAAKSMRSRFLNKYQKEGEVSFATFHSFFYQIIRSVPEYSQYRLIHEKEKKYILSCIFRSDTTEAQEGFEEVLEEAISFYKNTENIMKSAQMAGMDQSVFKDKMRAYEQEKKRRRVMDFDDLLFLCLEILKNDKTLLKNWKDRFDYYLVDEFQDSNPVQYRILRMLAGRNLFVVGDDDQAIYGFRGAQTEIMRRFTEDYPDAIHIVLEINYRCPEAIVKASSKVVKENKLRLEKHLIAYKEKNEFGFVGIKKWSGREELMGYIIKKMDSVPKERLSEHAIFFRTNQELQIYATELVQNNIPVQMKDTKGSIYEHFLVKDIFAFLKASEGDRRRELFLRILNKPRRNIGREALETEEISFEKIKKFYKNSYMYNPAAIKDAEEMEKHFKLLEGMPLYLRIHYIRRAMGYEKYLKKRSADNEGLWEEWTELLDWLEDTAKLFQTMQEWEEYQKIYDDKCKIRTEGVHLMTMHASKGLEFEHCYILNVNEGRIPKYRKGQTLTQEQLEEERRIFYVGMTRAKKTLELHYLSGTKERPKSVSRFIQKLL